MVVDKPENIVAVAEVFAPEFNDAFGGETGADNYDGLGENVAQFEKFHDGVADNADVEKSEDAE